MNPTRIYDWSRLNRDYSDIVQGVLKKWQRLVASKAPEGKFHRFLATHAGLFFGASGSTFVISKLQLGGDHREPDLVVVRDHRSGGLHYEFIELKRPWDPPFTAAGIPSHSLNKAMQQSRNYRAWLDNEPESARKLLPAKYAAGRSSSFTVIIGCRENSMGWLKERNQLASHDGVTVHSFDYLTDELMKRQFPRACSSSWVSADTTTLNQLANPFVKAFTDKSWRELLKRLEMATYEGLAAYEQHFLAAAGKELVKHRNYNPLFQIFVRRLKTKRLGHKGCGVN